MYAKYWKAPPGMEEADTSWLAGQKRSMRDYVYFIQDCLAWIKLM